MNLKCKECQGKIIYNAGEEETFDNAGYASSVECVDCGLEIERPADFICTIDHLEVTPKQLFKATSAGLTLSTNWKEVTIGGYTEGYHFEMPELKLEFPFMMQEFWDAAKRLDDLSCKVWELANVEDDDLLDGNYETITGLMFEFADA